MVTERSKTMKTYPNLPKTRQYFQPNARFFTTTSKGFVHLLSGYVVTKITNF